MNTIKDNASVANTSAQNTLAHELSARDEQFVGIFFAAFAIQYYLHKEMLSVKMTAPIFLDFFKVLIKKLLFPIWK